MQRRQLLVLAILLAILLGWLWWPVRGAAPSIEEPGPAHDVAPAPAAQLEEETTPETSVARVPEGLEVLLVDELTGEELEAPGLAIRVGEVTTPLGGPRFSLDLLAQEGAVLVYRRNPMHDAEELTWYLDALRERLRTEGGAPATIPLPYRSAIRGVVTDGAAGTPLPGVRVEAFLLDPHLWQRTLDEIPPRGMEFVAPYPAIPGRLAHYDLLRLQSVQAEESTCSLDDLIAWVTLGHESEGKEAELARLREAADEEVPVVRSETQTDANGRFELPLEGSGLALVWLSGAGRIARFHEYTIEPGATLDRAFMLSRRPVVRVVLKDEDGSPIPDNQVRVFVRMSPQLFDSSERDEDMALPQMAVGSPGAMRTIRYTAALTDADGVVELRMPYGLGYAALAEVDGEIAFDSIMYDPPRPPEALSSVELRLVRGQAGGVPGRVVVLDDEGHPLAGATVQFGIASDPWQRQFPEVTLDEEGAVELDWFPVGAHIGGAVQHPSFDGRIKTLRYFDWRRGLNVAKIFVQH